MPKNRHTKSADIRRSKRPGPITSAAESIVGRRARGNDGHMYLVKMDARGVKRWFNSSSPRRSSAQSTKLGISSRENALTKIALSGRIKNFGIVWRNPNTGKLNRTRESDLQFVNKIQKQKFGNDFLEWRNN